MLGSTLTSGGYLLMSKKVKIGVLGCANIAERFVIPAIKSNANFELVGVASRSIEKANIFAEKFKTQAFTDYESLIQSDIDAIYIPLPNSLHYSWIKKSLKTGLHVLVEKSLACSFKEVKELNLLAKEKNLVLVENFQFRFHSQLEYIKQSVVNGEIGELRLIRSSFGFPSFLDKDNIRYKKSLGGGSLLDAGAYPLKITQIFLGQDIYVDSASLVTPDDQEVDTWGSAFVKQCNGNLTAQIAFGFEHFYQNTLELWGSKGKLTATRIFTAGPGVEPNVILETVNGVSNNKLPEDNHFINMLNHVHSLIHMQSNLDSEYEQNINQARLLKELYERAK